MASRKGSQRPGPHQSKRAVSSAGIYDTVKLPKKSVGITRLTEEKRFVPNPAVLSPEPLIFAGRNGIIAV